MSRFITKQQAIQGLREAGFPEHVIPTMAAVMGQESSYDLGAYNPKGADNSYGLLQINMEGPLGPARRKQFGLKSNEDLLDFKTNLRAAKTIYDEQGLKAWGGYTDGGYKKFLPTVMSAYKKPSGQSGDPDVRASTPAPVERSEQAQVSVKSPTVTQQAQTKQQAKLITTPPSGPQTKQQQQASGLKRNLFRNLMGSVMQDMAKQSFATPTNTDADVYMQAASQLYSSEDPEDQALARKYERRALEQQAPVYEAPQNSANLFASLLG